MDEEQVVPAPNTPEPDNQDLKGMNKLLLPLFIILILVVGGGAFFIGSQKKAQPSPTPTPTVEASPTTPSSPTASPKATKSPSPTPTKTPTPTPTPTIQTKTINSTASLDGFRSNNGGGNATVDIRAGNAGFVGSPSFELVTRGFVSFDLSSLPSGATIEKVTLRVYQRSVSGTPYAGGNSLIVDSLDYGGDLANDDYARSPIFANIGTLTSNAAVEYKDTEVTNSVKNDISSGRTRSQFRIRFVNETDGDGSEDFAYFDSGDSGSNPPQIVIKYY